MKQFLAFFLIVGLILVYWKLLLLLIVLIAVIRAAPLAWREYRGEREARKRDAAALAARADQQHQWAMSGDPRGTFGEHEPAC